MDEAKFRQLISGETKGFGATLSRWLLYVCSFVYGTVIWIRNICYDIKWFKPFEANCVVVSIGNLTTGGTGKTPVVSYVANWFEREGFDVVIISRGYHQLEDNVNDEKLVLEKLCPGIPHILNKNRVEAVKEAIEEFDADVVVLDDAFQHRRLARDLDIVLLDMSSPFGYDFLLPRGMLREHPDGLQRAGLVMLTRVNQASEEELEEVQQQQRLLRDPKSTEDDDDLLTVEVSFPPERFINSRGASVDLEKLREEQIAAFCGIGNPDAFLQSLENLELEVAYFQAFPDHHHYSEEELDRVAEAAREAGCTHLLTTLKDLVKIEKNRWDNLPLWAVATGIEFENGQELLDDKLEDLADLIHKQREERAEQAEEDDNEDEEDEDYDEDEDEDDDDDD
ncbi:MAG: tetraacyldisaccharide 4'-kinase [Planctomycetaceae bacterium]